MSDPKPFDPGCRRCPRLVDFLEENRRRHPGYHCAPVDSFGDPDACFLIVGLAPGLHGANATGRPFTGDHAGILLYETLHLHGWGSAPVSRSADDDLELRGCRITNAVRCVPPGNKPVGEEERNCAPFLAWELERLPEGGVILALGQVAHRAVLRVLGEKQKRYPFGHGRVHRLEGGKHLVDSYHCSRYNTQTRRLTPAMFHAVFEQVAVLLEEAAPAGR
ncbi:MAG TPA: uracil-DNA glycosylase [Thiotrichales bacterium]|nr:uracil-DNA glycosylase [Thiotrichales bacterium]